MQNFNTIVNHHSNCVVREIFEWSLIVIAFKIYISPHTFKLLLVSSVQLDNIHRFFFPKGILSI